MHAFRSCVVARSVFVLGCLYARVNKPSHSIPHIIYHVPTLAPTYARFSVRALCVAVPVYHALLQGIAAKRSQTDEKVSQRDEWYPKIPCRSEDQQEQSVDSFQLAKT